MINFMSPREAPNPKLILGRMSEAGKCLLTGGSENLVYSCVDMDVDNVLPSNMACVTQQVVEDSIFTNYYDLSLWGGEFVVTIDTPNVYKVYNTSIFQILEAQLDEKKECLDKVDLRFPHLFELLTARHVKGLFKIEQPSTNMSMDRMQFMNYVMRALVKEQASNIIQKPLIIV